MKSCLQLRYAAPAVCLVLVAVMTGFYLGDRTIYRTIMTVWMLRPYSHPFIDWEWIPSAVKCWNRGVNVYVDNVCYAPVAAC